MFLIKKIHIYNKKKKKEFNYTLNLGYKESYSLSLLRTGVSMNKNSWALSENKANLNRNHNFIQF